MENTPILDILLSSWETRETFLHKTYKRLRYLDILTVISSFTGFVIFQIEVCFVKKKGFVNFKNISKDKLLL